MKKTIRYLIAFFLIFSLNFLLPRVMPGDPVTNMLGEDYIITPEAAASIRAELGLDRPLIVQYGRYWLDILQFKWGYSYRQHAKVSRVIWERIPWTLALVGIAIILGALGGIFWGAWSGWARNSLKNRSATLLFLVSYSMPPFFLSLLALYYLSYKLGIFPMRGFYESGTPGDLFRHFLLPVGAMALYLSARYFLIMRGSVIQEKGKHYVLYARAKGLVGKDILFRHIFKNAALPIITLIALDFGFIFSGALFVEIVFSMNGMGTLIYEALLSRDYPVLQGAFLIITVMVVAANFLADGIYHLVDPRLKKASL